MTERGQIILGALFAGVLAGIAILALASFIANSSKVNAYNRDKEDFYDIGQYVKANLDCPATVGASMPPACTAPAPNYLAIAKKNGSPAHPLIQVADDTALSY